MNAKTQAQAALTAATPLSVWDVADASWWRHKNTLGIAKWCGENLPAPATIIRVECYLLDGPFAVITRVAQADNGDLIVEADGNFGRTEPETIILKELPPKELWGEIQ